MRRITSKVEPKNSNQSDVDITPMMDVVFILLIFFVVTASFTQEKGLAINQPDFNSNAKTADSNIVVSIGHDQTIRINGNLVTENLLYPNIVRRFTVDPRSEVVVKVASNAYTSKLIRTLDELRKANVLDPPVSLDI